MKKMKFTAAALSMLLVLGSCGTSQKTGTAAGAGAGAFFSEHAVKAIRPIANARIDNFFIIFKFYMLIIMLI